MAEATEQLSSIEPPEEGLSGLDMMRRLAGPECAAAYTEARRRFDASKPGSIERERAHICLQKARAALAQPFKDACERGGLIGKASPGSPDAKPERLNLRPRRYGSRVEHVADRFDPLEDSRLLIGHVHFHNAQFWLVEDEPAVASSPKARRRPKPAVERILPFLKLHYPDGVSDSEKKRGRAYRKVADDMMTAGLKDVTRDSFRRAVTIHNKR